MNGHNAQAQALMTAGRRDDLAHDIQIPVSKNALRILNYFAVQFRYETCSVNMIDQSEMAVIIATLKLWAEQKIACFTGQ